MDVNGLRSFGLSYDTGGLRPWAVPSMVSGGEPAVAVEAALGHLVSGVRLANRSHGLVLQEDAASVDDVVLQPAMAIDALGNHVVWDGSGLTSTSHLAVDHGLTPRGFVLPLQARPVSDLTVGDDDVLYLGANGALWLVDLRGRFELTQIDAPAGFTLQRLASAPGGGVWALDVAHGAIACLTGLPRVTSPVFVGQADDSRFSAQDPNPDPPRWRVMAGQVPASEKVVSIATHRHGRLLVLSLLRGGAGGGRGGGARLRVLLDDGRLSVPLALDGPQFPHTLGWLDGATIAVATRGKLQSATGQLRDPGVWTYSLPTALLDRWMAASIELLDQAAAAAPAAALPDAALPAAPVRLSAELPADLPHVSMPLGDYYPLAGWTGGPFAAGRPGERLSYPRSGAAGVEPARVARVSMASRTRYGLVVNAEQGRAADARVFASLGLLDTRDPATVWHRLYVEAVVPAGCAMIVWLAASDTGPPAFDAAAPTRRAHWYPHLIGERSALPRDVAAALPADLPRAAWVKQPTEVPHGQSVLCCAPSVGKAGLFTVLIQRASTTVRALQGSRLWVAVELFGDGRSSPELATLRAYAGRLSYRDRYLPALYHEQVFGADAELPGRATGADFLDRFLHLFEGVATDIEGRIAASALITDAMACPPEALPWLSAWIGLALQPGLPTDRARWMLVNAPELARRHGTLAGLQLALDIATDGAVTRGRLVVVEDFRLRRTLSTILGADLTDATDPLTAGITRSGNSVLGDALFLGDARTLQDDQLQTFLALFRRIDAQDAGANVLLQSRRAAAQKALFDDLSHRVTVLVHDELGPDELGLVRRLAELGAPAHVLVRVVRSAYPFMVGVASLIGADTYLRAAPPRRPVRVGPGDETSALGGVDTLRGEASLDAHAGAFDAVLPAVGSATARPVARIRIQGLPTDGQAQVAQPFTLDASESIADTGLVIDSYTWSHLPPT